MCASPATDRGAGAEPSDIVRLRDHLRRRHRTKIIDEAARRAAVLVPIVGDGAPLSLLLFQRTHQVLEHKGEICFPGGAAEPGDADAVATALREAREELGLTLDSAAVLGTLDDVHTVATNYIITPVVGHIPKLPELLLDPLEVARTLVVSLDYLGSPGIRQTEARTIAGITRTLPFFPVEGERIWGATARILDSLLSFWLVARERTG